MTNLYDATADVRHFRAGYSLGWASCYPLAYAHGERDALDRVNQALAGCTSTFRSPRMDELRAARDEVPTMPCPTKCRRCSRCARSLSYWARGGRDYLGVEAEARLATVAAETVRVAS